MGPYTKDGIDSTAHSMTEEMYDLAGVVVHSGTAFAGHYFSYIRQRPQKKTGANGVKGKWFVFDDTRVEPYNLDVSRKLALAFPAYSNC